MLPLLSLSKTNYFYVNSGKVLNLAAVQGDNTSFLKAGSLINL